MKGHDQPPTAVAGGDLESPLLADTSLAADAPPCSSSGTVSLLALPSEFRPKARKPPTRPSARGEELRRRTDSTVGPASCRSCESVFSSSLRLGTSSRSQHHQRPLQRLPVLAYQPKVGLRPSRPQTPVRGVTAGLSRNPPRWELQVRCAGRSSLFRQQRPRLHPRRSVR